MMKTRKQGMKTTSAAVAALLAGMLAATASAAAQAEIIDIAWDAGGRFERTLSVAPGKFAEVCGKLERGLPVAWTFSAERPLNFNIHYHAGKQVVFAARQDGVAAAQGELAVEVDQDYCWMWSNKSAAAVQLRLTLAR